MRNLFYRLYFFAHAQPRKVLVGSGAVIFLAGMLHRNPGLAVSLALAIAISIYSFMRVSKRNLFSNQGLAVVAASSLCLALILSPESAHAAGGLAAWARAIKAQLGDIYDLLIYAAYGTGLFGIYTGIMNGKARSNGDTQIKTVSIFGNIVGGICLMMIGYFADSAAESVGGSSGQMNKMPGGL
jgi:hypothetical protein